MANAADAKLVAIALDDPTLRRAVREGFEHAGHRTFEVARGSDAAFAIDGRVSLVVSSVRDAAGLDRLRALLSRASEAASVVTTTAPRATIAGEALRLGVYDVLESPVEPVRLLQVAERALEHRAMANRVRALQARVEAFERARVEASATSACVCGTPHCTSRDVAVAADDEDVLQLRELERRAIAKALARTQGSVEKAARLLGIGRATLYRRLGEEKQALRATQEA